METAPKTDSSEDSAKAPRVEFAGDVLQQIRRHARSSMRAEICGVLIGDAAEGVTRVTARIAGEGASQGGAHVTFTQDTWEHIYKVKDAEFPSQSIVGWYHSHPGFGIFLSDYDLFIHENFFTAEHQIAWVFDPHSDEEGCFGWIGKKVEPLQQVTVIRKHRPPAPEQAQEEAASRKAAPPREPSVATTVEKRAAAPRRSSRIAMTTTVAIMAFVGGVLSRPYVLALKRAVTSMIGVPARPLGPPAPVAPTVSPHVQKSKSGPNLPIDIVVIPAPASDNPPSADPTPTFATPAPLPPGNVTHPPVSAGGSTTPAPTTPPPLPEVPPKAKPAEAPPSPQAEKSAEPKSKEKAEPIDPPKPPPEP
jgi:proteasome lid subunit RPN8/RPN11